MGILEQLSLFFCASVFIFGFIICLCNLLMKTDEYAQRKLVVYMMGAAMYATLSFIYLVRIAAAIVKYGVFK